MTSCNAVINLALSKLGVAGRAKPPRAEDSNLGLTTLQSLYRQLISTSLGRARDVIPTGAYVARENDRILRTGPQVTSISLPQTVTDERCFGDYNGYYYDFPTTRPPRTPRDGAFVIINDDTTGLTVEYIYEAYLHQWISVHDLSLQEYQEVTDTSGNIIEVLQPSVAPLSNRDLNGLAALLATKLADHYGASLHPATVNDAEGFITSLATRFGEPEERGINPLDDMFGHHFYH